MDEPISGCAPPREPQSRAEAVSGRLSAVRMVMLVGLCLLTPGCAMSPATLSKTTDRCILRSFYMPTLARAQAEVHGTHAEGMGTGLAAYIMPDGRIYTPERPFPVFEGPPDKQIGRFHEDGRIELLWPLVMTSKPLRMETKAVFFTAPEFFNFSPGCTAAQVAVAAAALPVIVHQQSENWRAFTEQQRELREQEQREAMRP